MSPRFDLSGKNALVTGASRGIGRAIALGFAQAGADVVLASRDTASLEQLGGEIEALGRKAFVIATDVTDAASVAAMANGAIDQLGSVDILVNNAGGSSYMGPFTTLRFSGWQKTMRLNVDSIVHACQAVGPHMLERGSGSIINVASVASLVGYPGARSLWREQGGGAVADAHPRRRVGRRGVRVNALCPGWTRTALNADLWGATDQHGNDGARAARALGRGRRDGRPSGVSRLRRSLVPDGSGPRRRRRADDHAVTLPLAVAAREPRPSLSWGRRGGRERSTDLRPGLLDGPVVDHDDALLPDEVSRASGRSGNRSRSGVRRQPSVDRLRLFGPPDRDAPPTH